MATPAATASIAATPPPAAAPAATPPTKKDFPTIAEGMKQELAAKGRLNSQYSRLLRQIVTTYENPIEAEKKEVLLKRLVEEAKKQVDNPNKVVNKAQPVKNPGIEEKVDELTKRVNSLFGEISTSLTAFLNTKQIDDLENVKLKESAKGEFKKQDRNCDKVDEFIRKNNDLMTEFIKLYKTLNHKIAHKTKLIASHIKIESADEVVLTKVKKKFGFSDKKVKAHFDKQEVILKARKNALEHLDLLNKGITTAFEKVQRETHYFLDCWVNAKVISRTEWRAVGNAPVFGFSTDSKRLEKMYRIENIKNLLPKPVGRPAAAAPVETKTAKKEEKPATAPAAAEPAPAAAAPAAAASTNPEKKEKKRKKNKHKVEVEAAAT